MRSYSPFLTDIFCFWYVTCVFELYRSRNEWFDGSCWTWKRVWIGYRAYVFVWLFAAKVTHWKVIIRKLSCLPGAFFSWNRYFCNLNFRYYRGRGAFESMGAGMEMQKGDIAFKVTFPAFLYKMLSLTLQSGTRPQILLNHDAQTETLKKKGLSCARL